MSADPRGPSGTGHDTARPMLPFEVWVKAPTDEVPWLWVGTRDEDRAEDSRAEVASVHPEWHVELRESPPSDPPVAVPGPASVSPGEPPEIAHKEPEPMESRERTLRFWLARLTAYPRWVSIGSINSHAELERVSAEDFAKIQEVLRGR